MSVRPLIESFPAPPTHIPSTPTSPIPTTTTTTNPNPPPSRPPSTPLPPVPGPSRVSGNDFYLTRSRRSSKVSLTSLASLDHRPSTTSPPPRCHSSLSIPEADEHLTRLSISPMPPLSDNDDDLDDALFAAHSFSSHSLTPSHQQNESLSSINMAHLLLQNDDDDNDNDNEQDNLAHTDSLADLPPTRLHSARPKHRPAALSIADPIDPQTLHLQLRSSRSSSHAHRQQLRSRSKSKLDRHPQPATGPPLSPLPALPPPLPSTPISPPRSHSPDISVIISTTPKPSRRRTSSTTSRPSTSMSSRTRIDSLPGTKRRASEGLIVAESRTPRKPRRSEPTAPSFRISELSPYVSSPRQSLYDQDEDDDDDDARSWIEHDEFGKPIDDGKTARQRNRDRRADDLERQLEGGASDSDSSLDLHTPLPHLMLRHGLLSPNSKLLPQSQEGAPRPDSVVSLASNISITTSGLAKDSRNTPMRRTRHRDGRLLKGGIGLTTGLGWSDSEDEDAPSPLTRRISRLNLSRNSSLSSIHSHSSHRSSGAHPLSRSYSSGAIAEDRHHFAIGHDDDEADEFGRFTTMSGEWSSSSLPHRRRDALTHRIQASKSSSSSGRSSAPPTAWQKRPGGKPKGGSASGRASTSSAGSHFSLEVSIPEHEHEYDEPTTVPPRAPLSAMPSPRSMYRSNSRTDDALNTPSTASTLSIPMPVTPRDDAPSLDFLTRKPDKEKSLPPLPPSLRRSPASTSTLGLQAKLGVQQLHRPRTYSSTTTTSTSQQKPQGAGSPQLAASPSLPSISSKPSLISTPRPLRLPQSHLAGRDRPAVPVPTVSYASTAPTALSHMPIPSPGFNTPRAAPGGSGPTLAHAASAGSLQAPEGTTPPVSPSVGNARPKPRTGTGMVYRNSAASRMRMPSMTAKSTGTPGAPRTPIAL